MNILNNPFNILGVTLRDNVTKISDAAEEKSLFEDFDECNSAKNMLINSTSRLKAELCWLPGVSPSKITEIINYIESVKTKDIDPEYIHNTFSRYTPIVYVNIEKTFLDVRNDLTCEDLYPLIYDLAARFDEIDQEQLLEIINSTRKLSAISTISSISILKEELDEYREECLETIINVINDLAPTKLLKLVTDLIDYSTDSGENVAPELIYRIVDSYETRTKGSIDQLENKLFDNINKILDLDFKKLNDDTISDMIKQFVKELKNWDKYAQPIQLRCMSKGEKYEAERLGRAARSIAVKLFNSGYEKQTEHLLKELNAIFAEVGSIVEIVEEDFATISGIKQDRIDQKKRDEEEHAKWVQEIRFDETLGTVFKDRLIINENGITWKGETIKLSDVVGIRYGASFNSRTSKSLFGTSTTTYKTYNIGIASKFREFNITFQAMDVSSSGIFSSAKETSNVFAKDAQLKYDKATDCLWRAVALDIARKMVGDLKVGKEVVVGDVTIHNDYVVLPKKHVFSKDEYFRCDWNDISFDAYNGNLRIKDDKYDLKAELPFADVYNAHILRLILHIYEDSDDIEDIGDIFG